MLFLHLLHTKSTRKCQEMLPKLKILFAYAPVTRKHPAFGHGHRVYEREMCENAAHLAVSLMPDHNRLLHDEATFCVYQ